MNPMPEEAGADLPLSGLGPVLKVAGRRTYHFVGPPVQCRLPVPGSNAEHDFHSVLDLPLYV